MGTGVAPDLWSPTSRPVPFLARRDEVRNWKGAGDTRTLREARRVAATGADSRPGLELIRPRVGCRRPVDAIKPSTVSTAPLRTFLSLHARPINLVVFQGSHVPTEVGTSKPDLEGGFPLRCFQRLSLPDVATLRCA